MKIFLILFIPLFFNILGAQELSIEKAYELLKIPKSANLDEVKIAFKKLYKSYFEICYLSCMQGCEIKNKNKKYKPKFCCQCTLIQNHNLDKFKQIKQAYNLLKNKLTKSEIYDLKNVEDRFVLYHKTVAISLLETYIKDIKRIKNDLIKEDPELNDFSQVDDYTNNLELALFYIKSDQFLKAKELLLKVYEQYPDFDFDNVQENLNQILNFKHVKEIELAQPGKNRKQ